MIRAIGRGVAFASAPIIPIDPPANDTPWLSDSEHAALHELMALTTSPALVAIARDLLERRDVL